MLSELLMNPDGCSAIDLLLALKCLSQQEFADWRRSEVETLDAALQIEVGAAVQKLPGRRIKNCLAGCSERGCGAGYRRSLVPRLDHHAHPGITATS